MKKKEFLFLCLFLVLSLSLVFAAENDTEQTKINHAYQCLTDKVSGKCSTLTTEEKVFSALATGNCRSDLSGDSKFKTDVKYTSQAILAMNGNSDAESWLVSRNVTPTELVWFLEIEATGASSCSIQYSGQSYNLNIDEDKKLSSNAGSCLVLAQDNYWLRVSPSCYTTEFSVSCNQNFLTTLLFKKSTSSTIHVSEKTSSAASGGTTKEKVESYCFAQGNSCNYESSLWAALALDSLGKDISSYLPYLITLADENQRFLPEAFLYTLTANTEYKNSLLSKQKSNQWWMESGDKFYDTALALYPLQSETPQEKTNSKNWLLGAQDVNGCWENNIRNTGFILASIWPRQTGGETSGLPDCEDAGYYCSTAAACSGEVLSEFDCPGSLQKCCSTPPVIETCSEQGGDICSSNQRCVGGTNVDASDLRSSEICCASGSCGVVQEASTCELNSGICRAGGCADSEQETLYSCDLSGDSCCIQKTGGKSYWWVWVLIILITLLVFAIIFRDRLKLFWFRLSSRGKSTGPRPPYHPQYSPIGFQRPLMQRVPERRILLPQPIRKPIAKAASGAQKELDEVLKKLKDMSK